MHGNVWNWCQEKYESYPQGVEEKALDDIEDTLNINPQDSRVMRGGSFYDPMSIIRSAYRNYLVPTSIVNSIGFRVARTFSSD
jgi:formylglycine-generating enzyme required for sulfatase activity